MSVSNAAASAASSSNVPNAYTATSANTLYTYPQAYTPGIYTITTFPTSSNVNLEFILPNGTSTNTTVTTGTTTLNLGSATNSVRYWSDTANTVITVTYVSASVSSSTFTGVLDVITTSGTYTTTSTSGYAYVMAVGGGGGAAGFTNYNSASAGDGGNGGIAASFPYALTGNIAVTIGNGGAGSSAGNPPGAGSAGNATTFGNLTANGGGGAPSGNTPHAKGNQGTPAWTTIPYPFIISSLTTYGNGGISPNTNITGPSGGNGAVYVFRY